MNPKELEYRILLEKIKKLQSTHGYENLIEILGKDLGKQIYDIIEYIENV